MQGDRICRGGPRSRDWTPGGAPTTGAMRNRSADWLLLGGLLLISLGTLIAVAFLVSSP